MPRLVLVLHEHAMLYEVAIAAEVFGVDRSALSPTGAWYDVVVACPERSPRHWLPHLPAIGVSEIGEAAADLIVVPSTDSPGEEVDPALAAALRDAHASGVRIARSSSPRRACWMTGSRPPAGCTPTTWPAAIRA
ncbi:hypothetical protein [Amycolatopsis rubida]|uniref:hypothetical protein n=1 Tax=Amycolatopsis sp. M39 TaxID=1825094 RepID=UPI0007E2816B|nr:transcriptional activator FtrA [Amycolatopsis sp. M39]